MFLRAHDGCISCCTYSTSGKTANPFSSFKPKGKYVFLSENVVFFRKSVSHCWLRFASDDVGHDCKYPQTPSSSNVPSSPQTSLTIIAMHSFHLCRVLLHLGTHGLGGRCSTEERRKDVDVGIASELNFLVLQPYFQ